MVRLLIAFFFFSATVSAQIEDLKTQPPSYFRSQPWFQSLLSQFLKHNKIDSLDASQLRLVSSDSRVATGTCAALIRSKGKMTESDMHAIAFDRRNDSIYYVISRSGVYSHLFVYNRYKNKLTSIQNTRAAVIQEGHRMELNAVATNLAIFAVVKANDPEDRHQFYLYHMTKGSLTHFKNCRRVKGKVECENVKL